MIAVAQPPTVVTLRTGVSYSIPYGEPGTYPWVRQASLIATAYRQVGDNPNADRWTEIYRRRLRAWEIQEQVKDWSAVVGMGVVDTIAAPLRITAAIGDALLGVAGEVKDRALNWAAWMPWLVLGALVVLGVGFQNKSFKVSL